MGSDESKTNIQVQNKDYDPAKLHKDKHVGEPMFTKMDHPKDDDHLDVNKKPVKSRSPLHKERRPAVDSDDDRSSVNVVDLDRVSLVQESISGTVD